MSLKHGSLPISKLKGCRGAAEAKQMFQSLLVPSTNRGHSLTQIEIRSTCLTLSRRARSESLSS